MSGQQNNLKAFILPPCLLSCDLTKMVATGVPTHLVMINEQHKIMEETKYINNKFERVVSSYEDRQPITIAEAREMFKSFCTPQYTIAVNSPPISTMPVMLSTTNATATVGVAIAAPSNYANFDWGGQFARPLPADFEFPSK
jgi:hypothetical protein